MLVNLVRPTGGCGCDGTAMAEKNKVMGEQ